MGEVPLYTSRSCKSDRVGKVRELARCDNTHLTRSWTARCVLHVYPLSLTLTLSLTHTHKLSMSLSRTRTHTHTHPLSIS